MRPLLADLEMQWRGGQNQVLLILKGLLARGHQPELVAAQGSALGERAAVCGVPVHSVSRGFLRLPAARRIHTLVRSGRFDLVHVNESHALTAAWLAQAHRALPLIVSRRVGYPIGRSVLSRKRFQAARWIIANSEWVAKQAVASGVSREKVTMVYEGVEIPPMPSTELRKQARARWGVMDNAPLLGCVGVFLPDKGQEWLIRALAELRREFPEAKLLLCGDGPCRSKLEALARQLGISEAVLFPGFVKDVESVYAALDIFLLPSFFEALNNSLLAAMANEVPSVAFERGALGEIIEHEKSGLLVSGPNVAEICAAVKRILQDRVWAKTLGEAGRKRVEENFSAAGMVEGIIHVYERAVQSKMVI